MTLVAHISALKILETVSLKSDRQIRLYRSMANSVKAGLNPVKALQIFAGSRTKDVVLADLLREIVNGSPFSAAMRHHPWFFPDWHVEVIAASELAGRMDAGFLSLAETVEDRRNFMLQLAGGLAFPILYLHIFAFVFGFLGCLGAAMAGSTFGSTGRAVLAAAGLLIKGIYGPLGLAFVLWHYWLSQSEWPRRLPLVVSVTKMRFCSALGLLVKAGISWPKAFQYASSAAGLKTIRPESAQATIAEQLDGLEIFTPEELAQLEIAELSGETSRELDNVAGLAKANAQSALKIISTILPLLMYVLFILLMARTIMGTICRIGINPIAPSISIFEKLEKGGY